MPRFQPTTDETRLIALNAMIRNLGAEIRSRAERLETATPDDGEEAVIDSELLLGAATLLAGHVLVRRGLLVRMQAAPGRPEDAGECSGFRLAKQDLICGTCGHPLERHSSAEDLGDTQAVPAEPHRHIDHNGRTGPLCAAPIRADGTCTVYPPSRRS